MNTMGISTDPGMLDVDLPRTLIESASVSTFLPEEEASIYPLLSKINGKTTPVTFSHPLTLSADDDSSSNVVNMCTEDTKGETSSSSGSSSGIGMDATDNAATSLFTKHVYQYLQKNNGINQELNGHGPNGNLNPSKDTPSFVSWNWPLIRKCTFFVFMSSLLAMCAIVVAMIITLPKTCNPRTSWFHGGVFYEIFPTSFQDSNHDGIGDIRGIANRIDYFASLGIAAVRLNSIFPSENYPFDYENIISLTNISDILGTEADLLQLSKSLRKQNISLMLDLPLFPVLKKMRITKVTESSISEKQHITVDEILTNTVENIQMIKAENALSDVLRKWIDIGIDGFYIKGLEKFVDDVDLIDSISEWKQMIGEDKVLIISDTFLQKLDLLKKEAVLNIVDLVDVHLDVSNGTKIIKQQIKNITTGNLMPKDTGIWIQWSIGAVDKNCVTKETNNRNATLAATLMQLMLPGSPNIFHGDEISLENIYNDQNKIKHRHNLVSMQSQNSTSNLTNHETLQWLSERESYAFENYEIMSKMIKLRNQSPSIYKNAICKANSILSNTQIRSSHDDIIVVERVYPRRNTFVAISNYGKKRVTMEMTSMYYSGHVMLDKTRNEKMYFDDFEIGPLETIIVKLDK